MCSEKYGNIRKHVENNIFNDNEISDHLPFYQKVALAAFSGGCGGLVGVPGDVVNVRMQNDVKLKHSERRRSFYRYGGLSYEIYIP